MTDEETELCKAIGREMIKAKNSLRNEDFDFNEEQWDKYYKLVEYAKRLAEQNDGTIEGDVATHESKWDTVTYGIRFKGEITFGDASASMDAFREAINLCDGFEIFGTGLDDGSFILWFFVSNMHIPKRQNSKKIITNKKHLR